MESSLLSQMEELISAKLRDFEQRISVSQRELSQSQLSAIQQSIGSSDNYTFRKKGHEEQFKVNGRILDNLGQADGYLQEVSAGNADALNGARDKIAEGIRFINHRQKCIKLADSSVHGWKVVQEYVCNPLADDSDDEKRIQRAHNQAERKARQGKRFTGRRYRPYTASTETDKQTTGAVSTSANTGVAAANRPGACFRCGKLGHWRAECKAVMEPAVINTQISNSFVKCSLLGPLPVVNCLNKKIETKDEKLAIESPVGRLKSCIEHWKNANANEYIMDVVENGYKLPFMRIPVSCELKNNKSALENADFVAEEIEKLLGKGCIREEQIAPNIVNPLTVAFGKSGKRRLVLDCRHINPELFKFKCHFEDQSVARQMFEKDDFLFTFDIRGAYHHIMINPEHCTYLGFAWHDGKRKRYYCYTVLAFGLSTAGYIFTKVMRTVVEKWRGLGYRVVVFLDDGMGGEKGHTSAKDASCYMREDLIKFGFLIAEEKCCWEPVKGARWLGLDWDTVEGKISVSEERVVRALELLDLLIARVHHHGVLISVRLVAAMVGQLLSMQCVIGKRVRMHTRFLYRCIAKRAGWNSQVMLDKQAIEELEFWKKNLSTLNTCDFRESGDVSPERLSLYDDASATGYGSYIEGVADSQVCGTWSDLEAESSSTWRELEAVRRTLRACQSIVRGKSVCVNSDSKNACSIMHIGSNKTGLQHIALGLEKLCSQNDVKLNSKWVPRSNNMRADQLSRVLDSDDWSVRDEIFTVIEKKWGPHTFDRFAYDYNTKCCKFNSRFWCPGTSGVDAFNCNWGGENNWVAPPPKLIAKSIRKIEREKSKCTLIVPEWKSAPFWPMLFSGPHKRAEFVVDVVRFEPGLLTKRGRGKNGIFDGRPLPFGLLVLRLWG